MKEKMKLKSLIIASTIALALAGCTQTKTTDISKVNPTTIDTTTDVSSTTIDTTTDVVSTTIDTTTDVVSTTVDTTTDVASTTIDTTTEVLSTTSDNTSITTTDDITQTTSDTTITQVTKYMVTVSFNTKGGNNITPIVVENGSKIEKPSDPIKKPSESKEYTFYAWYDENRKKLFDFENDTVDSDVVLTALYEEQARKYDITFDYNLEQPKTETIEVGYKNKVIKPTDPIREDDKQYTYRFGGWYTDPEFKNSYDFDEKITSSFTLYAKWNKLLRYYTVSFDTNGGNKIDDKAIAYGSYLEEIIPTKESTIDYDYTFECFYTDPELKNEFKFNETQITDDIKLYAKWTKTLRSYTVSFVTYGNEIASKTVKYGSYLDPIVATRNSDASYIYTFNCFSTSSTTVNKFDFENTPITHDTILYALYDTEPVKYKVTFNSNGGTSVTSQMVSWTSQIEKPEDPTKDGYKFLGWYNGNTKWVFTNDMPKKDITLNAQWEQLVSVTYILRSYNGEIYTQETKYLELQDGFISADLGAYLEQSAWYDEDGKKYNDGDDFDSYSLTVYSDQYTKGLSFSKQSGYYSVSGYSGTDVNVYIPYYYYGLPVKKVTTNAFRYNTSIAWVYLPDSITELESECFMSCSNLERIRLSSGLHTLPSYAFSQSGLVILNGEYITALEHSCFRGCESFTGFNNSSSSNPGAITFFEKIPNFAFYGCKKLESFNFKNVKYIDDNAFSYCSKFSTFINHDDLLEIGKSAFYSCAIQSFVAGTKLRVIDDTAFAYNSELSTFKVSDYLRFAGERIVSYTNVNFVVENNNKYIPSSNNDYFLLYDVPNTSKITINSNCKVIGSSTFLSHSNLKNIVIPDELVSIGNRAFMGCTSLSKIDINQYGNLSVIADYAFSGTLITTLNIPNSINYIGAGVLSGCNNITSINSQRSFMWFTNISSEYEAIDWEVTYSHVNLNKYTKTINIEDEMYNFIYLLGKYETRFVYNALAIK